jgi:hypothetical protein
MMEADSGDPERDLAAAVAWAREHVRMLPPAAENDFDRCPYGGGGCVTIIARGGYSGPDIWIR